MSEGAEDEVERLLRELRDDRRDVRSRAAYELGKHKDARTIEPLTAALGDADKFVCSWASGALGKAGDAAIAPLRAYLDDAEAPASYYAGLALGALGDPRSIPALAAAVREGDWDVKSSAAAALAEFGEGSVLPDRILMDTDLSPAERGRILSSLHGVSFQDEQVSYRVDLPDAEAFCKERSLSPDEPTRHRAVETLQALNTAPEARQEATVATPAADRDPEAGAHIGESHSRGTEAAKQETDLSHPEPNTDRGPGQKRSLWSRLTGRD